MESNSKLTKLYRHGKLIGEFTTENHAWWTAQQTLRKENFPKHGNTGFQIEFFETHIYPIPKWVHYPVFRDDRPCNMDWL